MIVLDCSYTLAMVMHDEARPGSLERVITSRLLVPPIWPTEVANTLRNPVRRRRMAEAEVPGVCARIEAYTVEMIGASDSGVLQRYASAHTHDLSAYDAAYLDLALQRRCALATLDEHLAAVARRTGVTVLD